MPSHPAKGGRQRCCRRSRVTANVIARAGRTASADRRRRVMVTAAARATATAAAMANARSITRRVRNRRSRPAGRSVAASPVVPVLPARYSGQGGSGDCKIGGLDALDTGLFHLGPGSGERAVGIDAAAGILDDVGGEALFAGVERGEADAEISRQTGDKNTLEAALLQIAAQPGRGLAVGLVEGRIAVDILAIALTDDEFGLRDCQVLAELRARRSLYAMVRPQHLLAVGQVNDVKRFGARMRGGERDVALRVPVLRHHDVQEPGGEAIDDRHDLVAPGHSERATWDEAVLHVDDDEDIARSRSDLDGGASAPDRSRSGERQSAAGCSPQNAASVDRQLAVLFGDDKSNPPYSTSISDQAVRRLTSMRRVRSRPRERCG